MKILDKYVAKNFIVGYCITAFVLVGLCLLIDLFINLDEFTERSGEGIWAVLLNIGDYYLTHSTVWFRDLAGFITVIAAVFSTARMTVSNEFIAVMASGVSLKRVIVPILVLSFLSTFLLVFDQQWIIPKVAHKLVRGRDEGIEIKKIANLWFMPDDKGSLICTRKFENQALVFPTILLRKPIPDTVSWQVTHIIRADSARYDGDRRGWVLTNGRIMPLGDDDSALAENILQTQPIDFYASSLTPADIPLKQQEGYKSLLSSAQLAALEKQERRVKDVAELYLQKNLRITDPIMVMIMLLITLPILVCRDPKAMKSAILSSFGLSALCFIATFVCKLLATENILFGRAVPEFWAWAPIAVFFPLALLEFDAMKT
jgi:lipopolysaccharide export system permease protein